MYLSYVILLKKNFHILKLKAVHFLRRHPDAILYSALRSNRDEVILINDLLAVVLERGRGIDGDCGWGLENAEGYEEQLNSACNRGKMIFRLYLIVGHCFPLYFMFSLFSIKMNPFQGTHSLICFSFAFET